MSIISHPDRTATRRVHLEAYFQDSVLKDDNSFICTSYRDCLGRCHGKSYFAGQLHYLGTHYDLEHNGKDLRIVVIGQDYGSPNLAYNMTLRDGDIRGSAAVGFQRRNPHMRGTTSTLRLLLGRDPGTDPEGESLRFGGSSHIFDGFALVNSLLCSAYTNPGVWGAARGEPTPEMYRNCGRHLRACLEILQPNVIVLQGIGDLNWWFHQNILSSPPTRSPHVGRLFGNDSLIFPLPHPSARGRPYLTWGNSPNSTYLRETIVPTIRQFVPRSIPDDDAPVSIRSDAQMAATREAITAGGVLSPDGRLHVKHISDGFGFIEEADLLRGVLRLVDKESGAETIFADADALMSAGWAVD